MYVRIKKIYSTMEDILIALLFLSKSKWHVHFLVQHFPLAVSLLPGDSMFVEMPCRMPDLKGATKIPRRWYMPWQKIASLARIACYMEEDGVCCAEVASWANIAWQNVAKWAKLRTLFDKLVMKARVRKSCQKVPKSQLASIEDELLLYIFEMRETGMTVDYVLVLFKAANLSQSFCAKLYNAQYCAFACFIKHHSYTYWMGTYESQHLLEEVANKARA